MDLVIFDLDGTLIDSQQDLANSVNATRVHMGLPAIDDDTVATWVGNGAPVLIRRAMGPEAPQEQVERALEYFMGYYREHMLDHTDLYAGVRDGLDRLRESGVKMAVLTNKPVRMSQGIVDGLGLGTHFFRVYGGNSFEQKKPDPIGIERLMAESAVARERTLMVGDSYVDIQTARNAGVAVAGVTWGLQPESLASNPPDVLVGDMRELENYILCEGKSG
jgi:phosphoglycolate phosphatase